MCEIHRQKRKSELETCHDTSRERIGHAELEGAGPSTVRPLGIDGQTDHGVWQDMGNSMQLSGRELGEKMSGKLILNGGRSYYRAKPSRMPLDSPARISPCRLSRGVDWTSSVPRQFSFVEGRTWVLSCLHRLLCTFLSSRHFFFLVKKLRPVSSEQISTEMCKMIILL